MSTPETNQAFTSAPTSSVDPVKVYHLPPLGPVSDGLQAYRFESLVRSIGGDLQWGRTGYRYAPEVTSGAVEGFEARDAGMEMRLNEVVERLIREDIAARTGQPMTYSWESETTIGELLTERAALGPVQSVREQRIDRMLAVAVPEIIDHPVPWKGSPDVLSEWRDTARTGNELAVLERLEAAAMNAEIAERTGAPIPVEVPARDQVPAVREFYSEQKSACSPENTTAVTATVEALEAAQVPYELVDVRYLPPTDPRAEIRRGTHEPPTYDHETGERFAGIARPAGRQPLVLDPATGAQWNGYDADKIGTLATTSSQQAGTPQRTPEIPAPQNPYRTQPGTGQGPRRRSAQAVANFLFRHPRQTPPPPRQSSTELPAHHSPHRRTSAPSQSRDYGR